MAPLSTLPGPARPIRRAWSPRCGWRRGSRPRTPNTAAGKTRRRLRRRDDAVMSDALADPLANLPPLRDVIRRYGLAARKSLGQNFLLDLNLTGRIARAAGPLDGVTV